ncbi:MAG: hypothetical protein JWO58_1590 [Chitinophagaceae bacterium]|nr:hypothetical protein [Chitinophagaceae bacterium]
MKKIVFVCILCCALLKANAQTNPYAETQVKRLQQAITTYSNIHDRDWNYFSCSDNLSEGDKSPLIPLLKKNLLLTGDLHFQSDSSTDAKSFDSLLVMALKQFQRRHNLIDDGILGAYTVHALNVSPSERRRQLQKGLEKWEHFAQTNVQTYLLVNLPDFTLTIIDSGVNVQRMKVLIGKRDHPTPTFSAEVSYIIIHPTWIIPRPIAVHEILPSLQKDAEFISKQHLEVYVQTRSQEIKLNADTIQWENFSKDNFNYQLKQLPGPWNPLGDIKFMFPNEHNIYIHDTPEKQLFQYTQRTFTHGCIRIENPDDLAAWLLHKSNEDIEELLEDSLDDIIFPLEKPVYIFIDHFNAWVDEEGLVQFREDVYPTK